MADAGEGAIDRLIAGFQWYSENVTDEEVYVKPARTELARLRDAALVVRLACSVAFNNPRPAVRLNLNTPAAGWTLTTNEPQHEYRALIDLGPIVDGQPVLSEKARLVIGEALGR